MGGEIKLTSRKDLDLAAPDDRGLAASVADYLSGLSGGNRVDRRKQKIRARLVRDYIQDEERSSSTLAALLGKLTNSL